MRFGFSSTPPDNVVISAYGWNRYCYRSNARSLEVWPPLPVSMCNTDSRLWWMKGKVKTQCGLLKKTSTWLWWWEENEATCFHALLMIVSELIRIAGEEKFTVYTPAWFVLKSDIKWNVQLVARRVVNEAGDSIISTISVNLTVSVSTFFHSAKQTQQQHPTVSWSRSPAQFALFATDD